MFLNSLSELLMSFDLKRAEKLCNQIILAEIWGYNLSLEEEKAVSMLGQMIILAEKHH